MFKKVRKALTVLFTITLLVPSSVIQAVELEAEEIPTGGNAYGDMPEARDSLLGIAPYFHIFAREATLRSHTSGNIATQNLIGAAANMGTNGYTGKEYYYLQGITSINSSSGVAGADHNKVVLGSKVAVDISDPSRPQLNGTPMDTWDAVDLYQDGGEEYLDFEQEYGLLTMRNQEFATKSADLSFQASDFPDMNNRVIDVSEVKQQTVIVNLSSDVLQAGTPLRIKGLEKGYGYEVKSVFINVDTAGQSSYATNSQINLSYTDGSDRGNQETGDFSDSTLLWNFTDGGQVVTGEINIGSPWQGSILAPQATLDGGGVNIDGSLMVGTFKGAGETHRWDWHGYMTEEVADAGAIEVIKHDLEDQQVLLAGAEFDLYHPAGTVVDQIVTDQTGHGQSTVPLEVGEYALVETKAPEGYELDPQPIPVSVSQGQETTVVTVDVDNRLLPDEPTMPELPGKGTIRIIKRDEDEKLKYLAGAEFVVLDKTRSVADEIVTDYNGRGQSTKPLDFGDYIVVETKAPEGYQLDATPIEVEVVQGGASNAITIAIENHELPTEPTTPELPGKGGIKIIKHDSAFNQVLLAGAEFMVLSDQGTVVDTIVTGQDGEGQTTVPLDFGDYTLVETQAPEGYELDVTPIPVKVVAGQTSNLVTVDIDNSRLPGEPVTPEVPGKGAIQIIKHDKQEPQLLLAGAEFALESSDGTVIETIVTDQTGAGQSTTPLDFGDYTLVETKAPEGYELDVTPIPVKVVAGQTSNLVTVDIDNSRLPGEHVTPEVPGKGAIQIIKHDKQEPQLLLAGAEFALQSSDGTVIETIVTDQTGAGQSTTPLEFGDYTLVETKAPEGYELDVTPIPVKVVAGQTSNVVTIKIANSQIKSTGFLPQTGELANTLNGLTGLFILVLIAYIRFRRQERVAQEKGK